MPELDALDPTHALDGWRPPAPAPLQDVSFSALGLAVAAEPVVIQARFIQAEPAAIDPTHVLDGWRPPAPGPLDLEIKSLLRSGGAGPDEAKRARLKARGYEIVDIEDVELRDKPRPQPVEVFEPPEAPAVFAEAAMADEAPVLDFQAASPAEPDPQQVLEDIQLPEVQPPQVDAHVPELDFRAEPPAPASDARQVIQDIELPEVPPPAPMTQAPTLDLPTAASAHVEPRLLAGWQPGAWPAVARRLRGARAEVTQTSNGPKVQAHAPQWLCALWSPAPDGAPMLGRWPELAALVTADTAFGALCELLDELPPEARLWRAELEVDWALLAELVLQRDAGAHPAQEQALRELAEAERGASAARMQQGYAHQGHVARRRA